MIYRISRTSDFFSREKPCSNAELRLTKTNFGEEEKFYVINIESLQDLMDLINEVGNIILGKGCIEIYDDYRE